MKTFTQQQQDEILAKAQGINTERRYRSGAEFLVSVRAAFSRRPVDDRLRFSNVATYGTEGAGTDGGFAAPPDQRREVLDPVLGSSSLLAAFRPIMCSSSPLVLAVDEAGEWTTTGVQATQAEQGATVTETKPKLTQVSVTLHKTIGLVHAGEEIDADNADFATYIWRRLAAKTAGAVEYGVVRGSGVNESLGVLNSPSAIVVAKESGQTAATIAAANVSKMIARLLPGSFGSALWIAHPTALAQIAVLGPGIYNPDGRGPCGSILGRPLYVSEFCNVLGQQGDLALVDPGGYAVGTVAARNATSVDFMWIQFLKSYRSVLRFGSTPLLSAPVQPRTGANTLSHTVLLAVR